MATVQRRFDRLLSLTRPRFDALEHVLARQPLDLRVERFHWFEDGEHVPEDERPEDCLEARVAIMTDHKLLGPFNDTHFYHRDLEAFFETLLGVGSSAPVRLTRTAENRFHIEVNSSPFQPNLQGVRAEFDFETGADDQDRRTPLLDDAFLARSVADVHRYANADGRARTDERWTLLDPDEYAVELCPGLWAHISYLSMSGGDVRVVFDRGWFRPTNAAHALDKTWGDHCGQLRLSHSEAPTRWEQRLLEHKTGDARLSESLGAHLVEYASGKPPPAFERRIFAWQRFALPL